MAKVLGIVLTFWKAYLSFWRTNMGEEYFLLQRDTYWLNSLIKRRKNFPPEKVCSGQTVFTNQVESIRGQETWLRC